MSPSLSRRRLITVSAAAAGLAVLPLGSAAQADAALVTWHGQAMGAVCTLQIHHPDRRAAEDLIRQLLGEVRRLERMFTLYDGDSTLVRLNRTGVIEAPPPEFVDVLRVAQDVARMSRGAFDVTVQPLWSLYAEHFSRPEADPAGPSDQLLRAALARVGHARLKVSPDRVVTARGTAITLNGIAQGFVTDKLVDLLTTQGVSQSLVDIGETRVLGSHPEGRPWDVAVVDPDDTRRTAVVVPVVDRALATSGPYGFQFDARGSFNHLFQPATGRCATRYKSVSVVAPTATMADALSTAFCFMEPEDIAILAREQALDLVHLIDGSGQTIRIEA
jgi:FAD:protein FMN transferase